VQTNVHFLSYLDQFFLEWKIFQTNVVEELNIRFMFNKFFEYRHIYGIMWKILYSWIGDR